MSTKRYNLSIPTELYAEIEAVAKKSGCSTVEIMRKFFKLGLLATTPGVKLLIENDKGTRELFII